MDDLREAQERVRDHLVGAGIGEEVRPHPQGAVLTVASKRGGQVILTADGEDADPGTWHGEPDDQQPGVYYERWDLTSGPRSHGYIHPVTRRLVQVG